MCSTSHGRDAVSQVETDLRTSGASAAFASSARASVKRRGVDLDDSESESESSDDEIVRPGRNRRRSSCVPSDDDDEPRPLVRLGVKGAAAKGDRIAFVFREGLKYGVCLGLAPKPRDQKRGLFKVRWEEDGDTGTLVMLTELVCSTDLGVTQPRSGWFCAGPDPLERGRSRRQAAIRGAAREA